MVLIFTIYSAIMGSIFSSFLTVVGYRVPKKISIANPPSTCSSCKHRLGVLDLIPVFSYIFSRGKCRHCGTSYGSIHMWLELLMGIEFALITYFMWGNVFEILLLMTFLILNNIHLSSLLMNGTIIKGINRVFSIILVIGFVLIGSWYPALISLVMWVLTEFLQLKRKYVYVLIFNALIMFTLML